jgi:hypothetical protein
MVRLSRVTLLIAPPNSDKSEVLQSAVMPLLSKVGPGSEPEVPILFDTWDKPPLPVLYARVRQAAGAAGAVVSDAESGSLVADLGVWQHALDVTFIIILDRFEEFLKAPPLRTGFKEFEEAFVHIANDPSLRANFLLALHEDAEPLLTRLRQHIPRLGYSLVRLPAAGATIARSIDRHGTADLYKKEHAAPERTAQTAHRGDATPAAPAAAPAPASASHHARGAKPLEQVPPAALPREAPAAPPVQSQTPAEPVEMPAARERTAEREARLAPRAAPAETIASTPPDRTSAGTRAHGLPPPNRAALRKGRFSRVGWVPLLLIPLAVFVLWPTKPPDGIEGDARLPDEKTAPVPPRSEPAPEPKRKVAEPPAAKPVAPSPPVAAAPPPPKPKPEPPALKPVAPPPQAAAAPAPALKPKPEPPAVKPVAPPPPVAAAPAPQPKAKPEPPAVKPAPPPPPVAAAPPPKPKPEPPAAKSAAPPSALAVAPLQPKPPPSVPPQQTAPAKPVPVPATTAPAAPQRPSQPEVAAAAPAAAAGNSAPARAAAAPSGPVVRILVRNESQRAWAEQLVGPLKERGIQVVGVRVAPPSADGAHIRYYRQSDRNEAMRVGVALRDLGLSAQHLKQMSEADTTGPGRQYDVWLGPSDRKP